ncbi:helix-turn-helix domain-containing protein [Acidovorax sp. Root217]|uniref:helix-turn-helix domain-containing protein n=1 Tax=Acidovorax sp. Root217 TaxID=1736492 RepID=UPI0009EA2FF0
MTHLQQTIETSVIAMTGSTFLPISVSRNAVMGLQITPTIIALNRRFESPSTTRGISASARAARIQSNPLRAEGIRQGRARLASLTVSRNNGEASLATLRMAAGLSQAELAEKIGIQQPNLARLEKRPGDPVKSTLQKLSTSLGVDFPTLLAAIDVSNRTPQS